MRALFAIFGASILAVAACGARSELMVDTPRETADAGPETDAADSGPDVVDAGPDVADAGPDVVMIDECADGGTTFIYVVTEENEIYRYYPPDGQFIALFTLACPGEDGQTPFSMAVDRKGTAYVVFNDGNLFRVSLADHTCEATAYQATTFGSGLTFGMGFSANVSDPGETLFIAGDDPEGVAPTEPEILGSIDVDTFDRSTVGQFPHIIGSAELTGTGDGQLFGFGVDNGGMANSTVLRLLQFDKTNAGLLSENFLTLGSGTASLDAWAFAFWGGDFYFFTSTMNGSSTVSRYTKDDPSLTAVTVGTLQNETIVGAGVSTCAPQH